jgi:hypothetical protein
MAEHSTDHNADTDFAAHQATYAGFVNASKYVGGGIIVLLILLATFLVR